MDYLNRPTTNVVTRIVNSGTSANMPFGLLGYCYKCQCYYSGSTSDHEKAFHAEAPVSDPMLMTIANELHTIRKLLEQYIEKMENR